MTDALTTERRHGPGLFNQPTAFVRGAGAYLYDADGREYLDFMAGIGVASVGHANERLAAAVEGQARRLVVMPQSYGNDVRAELLGKLTSLAGGSLERVFFGNSGTEANEAALKWARASTGREKLVVAKRGFAGRTLGALSLTWEQRYREQFGPLPGSVEFVTFNDVAELRAAVDEETAAFMVEPVQGEGGVHPATGEYLTAARAITRDAGALLVLDEVQCGSWRTGPFLAAHSYGVDADIVTLAKGLGGGVPISATLMTDEVAAGMPRAGHGSTFGGNPLSCAAALAVIAEVEEGGLAERVSALGELLVGELEGLRSPLVREVRGRGLMVGVELKVKAAPIVARLREAGFLCNLAGSTVLRLLPPLIVTEDQVRTATALIGEQLTA